jgi:hypothetical protein
MSEEQFKQLVGLLYELGTTLNIIIAMLICVILQGCL